MIIWKRDERKFFNGRGDDVSYIYGFCGNQKVFNIVSRIERRPNIIEYQNGRPVYGEPIETVVNVLDAYSSKDDRMFYVDRFKYIAAAKLRAEKMFNENPKKFLEKAQPRKAQRAFAMLGAGRDDEFYPTPELLAGKMFGLLNMRGIKYVLEPSAGAGDLVEAFNRFCKRMNRRTGTGFWIEDLDVDAIELNPELAACCKGKGIRIVGDDFLSFHTFKMYDAIIMNPPFSNGDKHLLKAISIMEKSGGQIVSLLNAETLRNPYSNSRKLLMKKLDDYNATVIYAKDAFKKAMRKTDVDVAIVYVNIPRAEHSSFIFECLEKAREVRREKAVQQGLIVAPNDWIDTLVSDFELDAEAGTKIIQEFVAVRDRIGILDLRIGGKDTCNINSFLRLLRTKYWEKLMNREELTSRMTYSMREEYQSKITDLANCDFSRFNIETMLREVSSQLLDGVKDSIMKLFDTLTHEHTWLPETGKNIHYYNGWATNKAHKVGKKVIIPLNGAFADSWSRETLNTYKIAGVISDIERALNFLDRGETVYRDPSFVQLEEASRTGKTKNVEFTYFSCDFFKKGTCHIKFHDDAQRLIERLNIFAGKEKAWLPPCYGKKAYQDMSAKEKAVIDDFQGKEEYAKVMDDPGLYITDVKAMGLLPAAM